MTHVQIIALHCLHQLAELERNGPILYVSLPGMKLFHWMLTMVKYAVLWDLWPHLALLQDCL